MLFGPIRAVVVDDDPIHLLTITSGLSAAGIPCASHWFNRDTNDLVPPPPVGGYVHLRLIFMDLNLRELTNPDAQTLFYAVSDALKKIVSVDCGPYILVFWTQVSSEVNSVRDIFFQPGRLEDIPHPLQIMDLRKGPFLPSAKYNGDFKEQIQSLYLEIAGRTAHLKTEIDKVTQTSSVFNTICGWESRSSEAAAHAINSIGVRAREDAVEDYVAVLGSTETILAEIAYETAGAANAIESPARALDAGMMEILVDQFNSSVDDAAYVRNVSSAIGPKIKTGRAFRDSNQMAASLNAYFHVETKGKFKATDRGVVLAADGLLTKELLDKAPETLIESEFLQAISKILKGLDLKEDQQEAKRAELKETLKELKSQATLVLVEVGADCDHAQAKSRTMRYLVGLEVPAEYVDCFVKDTHGKLVHEALQCLGPWSLNGKSPVYLLISCRRYWTWQKSSLPQDAVTKYRLRSSIVNKLLHNYTVWSSRPGIVAFRPR